jgi:hypothetical protein
MTATLLNCAMEQESGPKAEAKGEAKKGEEGKDEGAEEREGPCVESSIAPAGYEWYARGPGWRFRNGKFPADFLIRVSWHEEEEND